MINIADQLHAATADGVLANASEIKDGTKTQSQINSEVQAALAQAGDMDKIQNIDEDEIDAIINGVDTAAPYITFYSESEGKTETAYRYTEGDVFYKDVSHTCFSRVDGQRFYLSGGVWVDANGNKSAYYSGNMNVYASLTAESPIGYAEPHGFRVIFAGGGQITNL